MYISCEYIPQTLLPQIDNYKSRTSDSRTQLQHMFNCRLKINNDQVEYKL
jgi:hypothetical protein